MCMCCPEVMQRCGQLHMSRNNREFGLSSVRMSHTASSAHDVLETKVAVILCSSFLLVVPSWQDMQAAQAGRCAALVCYLYAGFQHAPQMGHTDTDISRPIG